MVEGCRVALQAEFCPPWGAVDDQLSATGSLGNEIAAAAKTVSIIR